MKRQKIQNNSVSQNIVVGQSASTITPPIRTWIGADWADQKHCLVVQPLEGPIQMHFLEQKPELLDQFFLRLRQQYPQGLIGICLEQSRGALLYALMKYDFLVIYP